MAHNLEMLADGTASMAWAGQTPWHGLGVEVDDNLTPLEMAQAASVDWTINREPVVARLNGKDIETNHYALVRSSDNRVIDVVPNDWHPTQNQKAFEFFAEFVRNGDMSMHTAGSLKNGEIVWALAKVNESFAIGNGEDVVESHLLFTNFHTYGRSIDIRFTPVRVVCNNTLTMAIGRGAKNKVSISHRSEWDPEAVMIKLGIARTLMQSYKDRAQYLASRNFNKETIVEYFQRVFPVVTTKERSANDNTKLSKSAKLALEKYLSEQPGAAFSEGSWWSAFNTVTFMTDHIIGRSSDTRLASAWYGANKGVKAHAMEIALDLANAA